jgi:hypothetical protein
MEFLQPLARPAHCLLECGSTTLGTSAMHSKGLIPPLCHPYPMLVCRVHIQIPPFVPMIMGTQSFLCHSCPMLVCRVCGCWLQSTVFPPHIGPRLCMQSSQQQLRWLLLPDRWMVCFYKQVGSIWMGTRAAVQLTCLSKPCGKEIVDPACSLLCSEGEFSHLIMIRIINLVV